MFNDNNKFGLYKGYVYGLYHEDKNKWYVGQTYRDVNVRFDEHRKASMKEDELSQNIHYKLRKYGWFKFKKVVLEVVEENTMEMLLESLLRKEVYWIAEKEAFSLGYNESPGIKGEDQVRSYVNRMLRYTSDTSE